MSSVLHKRYGFMGNFSHLVSNEERREGKTVVSFLWLEICNIITVSLNSNSVSDVHKSDSTTDITCSVW